jgi:Transposase IS116/IS110/IS902 family
MTRLRKAQVNERTRAGQRLEKVLHDEILVAQLLARRHARSRDRDVRREGRGNVGGPPADRRAAVHDPRGSSPHSRGADRRVRTGYEPLCDRGAPASWAGICPGHNESAGRRRSGRTRPGPRWLTEALTEAAKAAARTKDTYLAAHHEQLRGRRGEPKAIGATRHDILIAYYYIVRDRVAFCELGADWHRKRFSPEKRAHRLQLQLEALGYKVTLQANADQQAKTEPEIPATT